MVDYLSEQKKDCVHRHKKDLTQGLGEERHFYCPNCKSHWYKGRLWSRAEWELYVNDI